MITRPGSYDKMIIREQKKAYGLLDFKDKIVMDVGGNIGAFVMFAFANGATKVISYEPERENFDLLKQNVYGLKHLFNNITCTCINAGILSRSKKMKLYINNGKNKAIHSLFIRGGRNNFQRIKCLDFYRQCNKYKPDVVKIDTEGSEYETFDFNKDIASSVKQIALELHLTKNVWKKVKAFELVDYLISQGFKLLQKPNLKERWTTYFIGKRK